MANESHKQPQRPGRMADVKDTGIDESVARNNRDRSQADEARTGISERLQAQKEGRHIPATDPDGKPYGHDWDPDSHEKGRARTGSPGNEI
jgi:hypothetical protein